MSSGRTCHAPSTAPSLVVRLKGRTLPAGRARSSVRQKKGVREQTHVRTRRPRGAGSLRSAANGPGGGRSSCKKVSELFHGPEGRSTYLRWTGSRASSASRDTYAPPAHKSRVCARTSRCIVRQGRDGGRREGNQDSTLFTRFSESTKHFDPSTARARTLSSTFNLSTLIIPTERPASRRPGSVETVEQAPPAPPLSLLPSPGFQLNHISRSPPPRLACSPPAALHPRAHHVPAANRRVHNVHPKLRSRAWSTRARPPAPPKRPTRVQDARRTATPTAPAPHELTRRRFLGRE